METHTEAEARWLEYVAQAPNGWNESDKDSWIAGWHWGRRS